jgi:hypothetical protein
MGRYQPGHVFEQHSAFHVRYYTTELIDGEPKRACGQAAKYLRHAPLK